MQNIVTEIKKLEEKWVAQLDGAISGEATGTLLTDSDRETFVYLIDGGDQYEYVHFPKETWSTLQEAYLQQEPIYLQMQNNIVELIEWQSQLEMLLMNIEGNGNYGTFTEAVEQSFASAIATFA
ncbi:MAG TPA: hypothetical protein VIR13_03580 [Savagea sp.]